MAVKSMLPEAASSLAERFSRFGVVMVLAGLGQWALQTESLSPLYGVGLYLVAGVLFVISLRQIELPSPPWPVLVQAPRAAPKRAFWLTSLGLGVLAMWGVANLNPKSASYIGWFLIAVWLASLALFIGNTLYVAEWRWPTRAEQQTWWRAHQLELLLLAVLGGLALLVRTVQLELVPYAFLNDEGEIGQEAVRILRGEHFTLFEVGWAAQPLLSFMPAVLAVELWGHTAFAIRIVSAMQGALTVVLVYVLGREMFGRATGWLAAGFLLALPWHVHFSRLGVNNVVDSLTSTASLWLVYRAVRRGGWPTYLWAGLVTGLALYVYLGSRLAILLAVGTLGYVALFQRGFLQARFQALLVFAGAMSLAAAPMATFFWRQPDLFFARLNREGIIYGGWLQNQIVNTGQSYVTILLEQFSRSSLVYVARPAIGGFFDSPIPYLTFAMAIFFGLGLAYALGRLGELRYLILGVWFWSVVILGGALTLGPPASQRLLMSAPALALLVAVGLRKSAQLLEHTGWVPARLGLALSAVVVLMAGAQGLSFYFGQYQRNGYFELRGNELSYESRVYTSQLGSQYQLYLLGDPQAYIRFANFSYFAPDLPKTDFNIITPETLAALPYHQGAFFIAIPSRRADLELVAQHRPGGEWIVAHRRHHPTEVLYYAYQLPPATGAQP